MKEIFVIYNRKTGLIEGGAGNINREWDHDHMDGSTMVERIQKILAKDHDRRVVYFPRQDIPDPKKHKIENERIVDLTEAEIRKLKK